MQAYTRPQQEAGEKSGLARWRVLGVVLSLGCFAAALRTYAVTGRDMPGWWLLGAALAAALVWQSGVKLHAPVIEPGAARPGWVRRIVGLLIALAGAVVWIRSVEVFRGDWSGHFDQGWFGWLCAAALLSVGLELAWGRWRGERRILPPRVLLIALLLLAVGAAYRTLGLIEFPGEYHISKVEELQVGLYGGKYLQGARVRWEFLSHMWLSAFGLSAFGPSMLAMRIPFAAVSALKLLPFFIWLRCVSGTAGAVVGTALLAFAPWDVILSRIPNNQNELTIAVAFALLAGPARRGRPWAYVWLGFIGGYLVYEYITYRPLIFFIFAGAAVMSLRDRTAGWAARLLRPALTIALAASMSLPLFLTRIDGRVQNEYLNGWNRARGVTAYYNPDANWRQSMEKRLRRTRKAFGLFFFKGDLSPVRNLRQRPLVEPVTAGLALLGAAYAVVHPTSWVVALTLIGFLVTIGGSLVATGNFEVARAGALVAYTHALAGYGAASLFSVLRAAWGNTGRLLAQAALAIAVLGACFVNTSFLFEYWRAPLIRQIQHSRLAYLTVWLRDNVRDDERIVGISPTAPHVLLPNDASWLLGRTMPGAASWDVAGGLSEWAKPRRRPAPERLLLFVAAGSSTDAVVEYLEWLLPDVHLGREPDPLGGESQLAYAHLDGTPAELAQRLAEAECYGVRVEYELVGAQRVPKNFSAVVPFIGGSTWSAAVRRAVARAPVRPSKILLRAETAFEVREGGTYVFQATTNAGRADFQVDGEKWSGSMAKSIHLAPGLHTLRVSGEFQPLVKEPMTRLKWRGPDSGGVSEIMPLYRLAPPDPKCFAAARRRVRASALERLAAGAA